jgi:hypothetical protein
VTAAPFTVESTGQRVNELELSLNLQFGQWAVVDRRADRWLVRTREGEELTLRPVG